MLASKSYLELELLFVELSPLVVGLDDESGGSLWVRHFECDRKEFMGVWRKGCVVENEMRSKV